MLLAILEMEDPEEKELIGMIYEKYKNGMVGYAYRILGDFDLAEDAVNNAVLGLIRNVKTIKSLEEHKVLAYVITCTRNASYDILRKKSRHMEYLMDDLDVGKSAGSEWDVEISTEDFIFVHEAIRKLPERYQSVLLLRYFHDYDYKTIAKELGISVSNVSVTLNRAKAALKKEILAGRAEHEQII